MKNLNLVLVLFILLCNGCKKDVNNLTASNNSNGWILTNYPAIDGGFIISGTNLFVGSHVSGIFRSSDGGASWSPVDSGLNAIGVTSLAASTTYLFAGTAYPNGVFRSTNQGAMWVAVDSGLTSESQYIPEILCLLFKGANLFAGTVGMGVVLSTNNGMSWTSASNGLYSETIVYTIVPQASDLFISTNYGIYRSGDDGATWTSVSGLFKDYVFSLVSDGANLFAAGLQSGLYISTDKGTSWIPHNEGLTTFPINTLATSDSNIFVGTNAGLFLSTNIGASWTDISKGLPGNIIYSLVVYDKQLYADIGVNNGGTISESVWRRPF